MSEDLEYGVSVENATHVKVGGRIEKIVSKYGIHDNGHGYASYNKPSEGGFGVKTESGRTVSMWQAQAYLRNKNE
jgi:hypothetical protein